MTRHHVFIGKVLIMEGVDFSITNHNNSTPVLRGLELKKPVMVLVVF